MACRAAREEAGWGKRPGQGHLDGADRRLVKRKWMPGEKRGSGRGKTAIEKDWSRRKQGLRESAVPVAFLAEYGVPVALDWQMQSGGDGGTLEISAAASLVKAYVLRVLGGRESKAFVKGGPNYLVTSVDFTLAALGLPRGARRLQYVIGRAGRMGTTYRSCPWKLTEGGNCCLQKAPAESLNSLGKPEDDQMDKDNVILCQQWTMSKVISTRTCTIRTTREISI